jgi:glycosyltransferase involved in cell wall biosynthesis
MSTVLADAAIVVLPSFYGEGIPKALIEAAACGRPIVTTDTPGCREVVRHEDNGLLVPPRDAEALGVALRRLIEDQGLRSRMGARGRERALAEFDVSLVVRQTVALYRRDPA